MENQLLIQNNESPNTTQPQLQSQPQPPSSSLILFNGPSCSITIDDYDYDYNGLSENSYLDSFPPGYRFQPYDEELIEGYLKRKLKNLPLPPNRIHEVNIYQQNPDTLSVKYQAQGEKEWYFFTPRDKKYPNGQRPNRKAKDGFWKATGADKVVKLNGRKVIGYKKTLVFYQGKTPNGNKTSWIMQEYKIDSPSNTQRDQNDMKLDDWVLCKIYKKEYKKAGMRNGVQVVDGGLNDDIEQPIMRLPAENSTAVTSEGTNYSMHNIIETEPPTEMDTDRYNQQTYIDSVATNIMPQVFNQHTYIDSVGTNMMPQVFNNQQTHINPWPGGCQDDVALVFSIEERDYLFRLLEPDHARANSEPAKP